MLDVSPEGLRRFAGELAETAEALQYVAGGLESSWGGRSWSGPSADAFHAALLGEAAVLRATAALLHEDAVVVLRLAGRLGDELAWLAHVERRVDRLLTVEGLL